MLKKKKLKYSNLLSELLLFSSINDESDVIYNNKIVAFLELNDTNNLIECVCIDKDFYNFLDSIYYFESPFLVWDWSNEINKKDSEINIIEYYINHLSIKNN